MSGTMTQKTRTICIFDLGVKQIDNRFPQCDDASQPASVPFNNNKAIKVQD